jgi:hypothetical protein
MYGKPGHKEFAAIPFLVWLAVITLKHFPLILCWVLVLAVDSKQLDQLEGCTFSHSNATVCQAVEA